MFNSLFQPLPLLNTVYVYEVAQQNTSIAVKTKTEIGITFFSKFSSW